ncbi:MAG: hypothetical protein KGL59_04960 [Acidobacteriota bacterium]|nr:hypothetical protein [Acidobacteriota bacterium]
MYPTYRALSEPYGISALNDQVAAAMLMWVAMLVVFLAAAAFVIVDLLDPRLRRGPEAGVPAQPIARGGRNA